MSPRNLPLVDPSADTTPRMAETRFDAAEVEAQRPVSDVRVARTPSPVPRPGEHIADYQIIGQLGGGGMGVVLAALDRQLGRKVAIKLIHAELRSVEFRARFTSEARAMARVSHPNVVTIHAFGEHEDAPFMVMELVEGETLEAWLAKQPDEPDVDEVLRILTKYAWA